MNRIDWRSIVVPLVVVAGLAGCAALIGSVMTK
jgi:hypothetical protein